MKKICSAAEVRRLDQYTINQEPISSFDLMERASGVFVEWFERRFPDLATGVCCFCGPGNNGGDGLAVARLLHHLGYDVRVVLCQAGKGRSPDNEANLSRLPGQGAVPVLWLQEGDAYPDCRPGTVIVDAIFGSGLNRPLDDYWGGLLAHLNSLPATRIAIDVPSGVMPDSWSGGAAFAAHHTLSFELPKLAFMMPEYAPFVGEWEARSIGLHPEGLARAVAHFFMAEAGDIAAWLPARQKFSHKGGHGHALLIAGSHGKVGAAVLAARGALKAGAGLLTVHVPQCGYSILQIAVPEAMASVDAHQLQFSTVPELGPYRAIGVGCGLGQGELASRALGELITKAQQPLVLDADALNLLSAEPSWLLQLPEGSVLTPHPKEFERLFGPSRDSFERLNRLREQAQRLGQVILLKGAHTAIACPDGTVWFNPTGNPALATGGSGDVLTGIITALMAQGLESWQGAVAGAYLHGLSADLAVAATESEESFAAGQVAEWLGRAFKAARAGGSPT
ncbi:NAD(P)H-hydrate dehydratase [Phaeodactylibacter luteus]|uniref:Bifunctional NAD(P)H-hydrate repair enzyme n=1 Tax=Phaeodactylibacter luteus TaxID=1564516 RepID=A0A5C6S6Y2_9BACT|nr:NAD(P)H-hydrate dehydratase [Phaeodactylibacter luteus]TXB70250.1 NAD(P)H-hydrate dehydratase [Phaeodactylibacter luteus]